MLVLFDHKDGKVRAAAVALCQELYRWMKDALTPSIQDLKPAMVKTHTHKHADTNYSNTQLTYSYFFAAQGCTSVFRGDWRGEARS